MELRIIEPKWRGMFGDALSGDEVGFIDAETIGTENGRLGPVSDLDEEIEALCRGLTVEEMDELHELYVEHMQHIDCALAVESPIIISPTR